MRPQCDRRLDENRFRQRFHVGRPQGRWYAGAVGCQFHHGGDIVQAVGVGEEGPRKRSDLLRRRPSEQVV